MKNLKCLYLYWIALSAIWAVLPKGPVRANPHGSSVTAGGIRNTRRKPAMLGRVTLDNTLLTCDKGNFNQITAGSRNRILVTVVRDTCTTTLPQAPRLKWWKNSILARWSAVVFKWGHLPSTYWDWHWRNTTQLIFPNLHLNREAHLTLFQILPLRSKDLFWSSLCI